MLEDALVVHLTRTGKKYLSSLLAGAEELTAHHRDEKRLGRYIDRSRLSCAWFKLLNRNGGDLVKPDHLLFEMETKWCIKCNTIHWMFGEKIEFEQTEFNPNDHWTWQLEEMGFFDKALESNRPND